MCYGERTTAEVVALNWGADTPGCHRVIIIIISHCHQPEQSEGHTVEECTKLTELRREVGRDEMVEWRTRHSRSRKCTGDAGERFASFFYVVYDFLTKGEEFDVTNFVCTISP